MAMIPVQIGDTLTEMDENDLLKLEGGYEDDNEIATWVQYHLKTTGLLVHRSASVHLKKAILGDGAVASFG